MEGKTAERFFEELYSGGSMFTKVAVAMASTAYSVAISIILARLVAAERNLPENQRTIIVRFTSDIFTYLRIHQLAFTLPRILLTLTGPWGEGSCSMFMVVENMSVVFVAHSFTIIITLKATILLILKNVWALQDDFWLTFFRTLLSVFAVYSNVPLFLLPGKYPITYTLCVGYDADAPYVDRKFSLRNMHSRFGMTVAEYILFAGSVACIKYSRWKEKKKVSAQEHASIQAAFHQHQALQEGHWLDSTWIKVLFYALWTTCVIVSGRVHAMRVHQLNPRFMEIFMMVMANLVTTLPVAIYLLHHPRMRRAVVDSFKK